MKKKLIYITLFICFILVLNTNNIVSADRPKYNCSPKVFEQLPSFPEDFYEIKHLFATQQITAAQLGVEYLQPEILPNWDFLAERYYNQTNDNRGIYGLGFYPSRFDIYNYHKGDIINISSIVYNNPGVSKYQGGKITIETPDFITVNISENHFFVQPTYPYFQKNWADKIEISIKILDLKPGIIKIYQNIPDQEYDTLWRQQYNSSYVSGNSLLNMRIPCIQIHFNMELEKEQKINNMLWNDIPFQYIFLFVAIMILFITIGGIYAKHRFYRQKD